MQRLESFPVEKETSYGHPHKELLERLKEKQIGWYVTIERGAITVTAGKINKLSFYKK